MKSEMKSEVYAAYVLYTGPELDPEQVTSLINLTPSRIWRIGDRVSTRAALRHEKNGWYLKSNLPISAELEEHVHSVVRQLLPAWEVLRDLGARHEAEMLCVVSSFGGDRPAINFDKDVVRRLAELNAAIGVDLYVFH